MEIGDQKNTGGYGQGSFVSPIDSKNTSTLGLGQIKEVVTNKAYIGRVVNELAAKLRPSHDLYDFVGMNTAIIGAHAEAVVNNFIKDFVSPLQVCTGTVINPDNRFPMPQAKGKSLNQLDVIVWAPNPFPPVFHIANFGLVPVRSVFGIIEVKAFPYETKKEVSIDKILNNKDKLIPNFLKEDSIICVIPLIRNKDKLTPHVNDLIKQKKVLILTTETKKGEKIEIVPNHDSIIDFINYLNMVKESYFNPENKRFFSLDKQ